MGVIASRSTCTGGLAYKKLKDISEGDYPFVVCLLLILFTTLFTLPPRPFHSSLSVAGMTNSKWLSRGVLQSEGGEKLPAFVILTPSGMRETTIKHPAPHLTWADCADVEGAGSDMVGGVRVRCILGLAALWAQWGTLKTHRLPGPQLLPRVRVRKAWGGTGTGCLFGQSSFLSEKGLPIHSSNEWKRVTSITN